VVAERPAMRAAVGSSSTLGLCALIQKLIGCKLLSVQASGAATCLTANSKAAAAVSRCAVACCNWISYGRGSMTQIALAENLAIAEMDFDQVAADLSAQSDRIHSGQLSRKLDVFPKRERHGYDRRRRRNVSLFGLRHMRAKTPDAGARGWRRPRPPHTNSVGSDGPGA
jgi:hypothetical protein